MSFMSITDGHLSLVAYSSDDMLEAVEILRRTKTGTPATIYFRGAELYYPLGASDGDIDRLEDYAIGSLCTLLEKTDWTH